MGKFILAVLPGSSEKPESTSVEFGDNDRSGLKILTYMLYYAYYNTFEDALNKYYLQQIMDTSSEKSSPSFQTVLEKMLLYMNDIEKYQGVNEDENGELFYDNKISEEITELIKLIGDGLMGDLFYELQTLKIIKANKNAKTEITKMYKNFSKDDSYDLKYYSDLTKYTKNMLDENNKYIILMSNVVYNLFNIHNEKIFYSLNYDISNTNPRIYGNITNHSPTLFTIEGIKGREITVVDLAERDKAINEARQKSALARQEAALAKKPAPGSIKPAPVSIKPAPVSIKPATAAPETLVPKKELKNPHAEIKKVVGPDDNYYTELLNGKKPGVIKTPVGGGTNYPTTGISNNGNTCWFNTFLQLLWDFSDFRNFVINTMNYQFINELKFIHHQNLNLDFDMTDRELAYFKNDKRLEFTEEDGIDGIDGFADFLRALHVLFKTMHYATIDKYNNYIIEIKKLIVHGINRPVVSCYMYILNKVIYFDVFETKEQRKTMPDPIEGYRIQADALTAFQWFLRYFTNVINRPILDLLKKFSLIQRNKIACLEDTNISFSTPILEINLNIAFTKELDEDTNFKNLQYIIDGMTAPSDLDNSNICSNYDKNNGENINATNTNQFIPFENSKYIYISMIRAIVATSKKYQADAKKSNKSIIPDKTLTISNINYKLKGVINHFGGANGGHYTYYSYENDNIAYNASDRDIEVKPNTATHSANINTQACGFLYEIDNTQSLDHNNSLKRIPFKLYEHDVEKGLLGINDDKSINIANDYNVDIHTREEYLKLFIGVRIRSVGFKETPTKLDKSVFGQVIQESTKTGDEKMRIDVAKNTIDILEQDSENGYLHFQAYHNLSVWENLITKAGTKNKELEDKYFTILGNGLRILQGDWGVATLLLTKEFGKIFSCLNMANSGTPGSSYLQGKSAQEENMFRRTDCHYSINERHIKKQADYDAANREVFDPNTRRYNLKMFNLIEGQPSTDPYDNYERFVYMDIDYPRICIKGKEEFNTRENKIDEEKSYKRLDYNEIFPFYELRAAAKNYSDPGKKKWPRHDGKYPEELKDIIELRLRIRAQINTLKAVDQKYAVLSAFGAGAFKNDCSNVAMIYYDELLAERDFFKVIAFAIHYSGNGLDNYSIFREVFRTWPAQKEIVVSNLLPQEVTVPSANINSENYGRPNTNRSDISEGDKARRLVMEDTLTLLNTERVNYYGYAKNNFQTFKVSPTTNINVGECLVTVVAEDSLSATKIATTEYGIIFACLNFADPIRPGGGYRNGRHPQEEDIFLRTDCHFSLGLRKKSTILFPKGDFSDFIYEEKKTALIQGITGRVYLIDTPQICFSNNSETNYDIYPNEEIFPFYELRAAALNFNPGVKGIPHVTFPNNSIEAIAQTELRIAAQLDTLIERGLRCVVLGAFGCGAFQNNPNIVAKAYHKEITKRKTHFDIILFAMAATAGDNYDAFNSVFEDWDKKV